MQQINNKLNICISERIKLELKDEIKKAQIADVMLNVEFYSRALLAQMENLSYYRMTKIAEILFPLAEKIGMKKIKIYTRMGKTERFTIKTMNTVDYNNLKDTIQTMFERDEYITIVHPTTGIVIACSPSQQPDGTIRPSGIMKDARRVWVPEWWEKRNQILERDGFVTEFMYQGYTKSEVDNPDINTPYLKDMCVNSRIVNWFGEKCILSSFVVK